MATNDHETTIRLDEDRDAYVRDCTCRDANPTEHRTYNDAFAAGLSHWTDTVKGR